MTKKKECPFCKIDALVGENIETLQYIFSNCLCGKFIIDRKALADKSEYNKILKTDDAKKLFSGYLRNNQTITITEKFISEELAGILEYCQTIPLNEKISRIESYIYRKTTSIGNSVQLDILLKTKTHLATVHCVLTIEGFSKIESTLEDHSQSKNVFIACKFDTDYQDDLVKTIKEACLSCGFEASLVSDERHNKDISQKIISDIRQSKFVIADFTDENNGVYFEAGYAMGESKEVIRLIDKEQIKKLHFDTRQFHHIPWEMNKWGELKEDLINQIKATIK